MPPHERIATFVRRRTSSANLPYVLVLTLAAALSVLVGQSGRELLPPDDLREAEIAREMWLRGDYLAAQHALVERRKNDSPPKDAH